MGDRTYYGADAETMREIFRTLSQELQLPPKSASSLLAAIADLVQQVRSRLHDDTPIVIRVASRGMRGSSTDPRSSPPPGEPRSP